MRAHNVMVRLAVGILSAIFLLAHTLTAEAAVDQGYLQLPRGIPTELWAYFIPKDNPLTPAKVALGRQLFFDTRLSADSSISCATCHDPKLAFTDGKKVATGIQERPGTRNTPTILNAMFQSSFFWDGRADSLEMQAKQPLINPDEMGNSTPEQVVSRLNMIPEYVEQFGSAFSGPITVTSLVKALATFERTLVSGNSPFDRFLEGDNSALNDSAQKGFNLFRGKARCNVCHSLNQSFPFLTDGNYRNTGVATNPFARLPRDRSGLALAGGVAISDGRHDAVLRESRGGKSELGRFLITGNALDIGAFRTPSLRNIELTAPYFHDGSAATLSDVVRFYRRGGNENSLRDWELQPVNLTESEQQDLIEFLKALTSDDARALH